MERVRVREREREREKLLLSLLSRNTGVNVPRVSFKTLQQESLAELTLIHTTMLTLTASPPLSMKTRIMTF